MSAVRAMQAARRAGVMLTAENGKLKVRSTTPPPKWLIEDLRQHKAEILDQLTREGENRTRTADVVWDAEDWRAYFDERAGIAEHDGGSDQIAAEHRAFACCIAEWQNRNPEPSRAGRCAWCGETETVGRHILPFGIEHHTHLHPQCASAWFHKQRAKAEVALSAIGIKPPAAPDLSVSGTEPDGEKG